MEINATVTPLTPEQIATSVVTTLTHDDQIKEITRLITELDYQKQNLDIARQDRMEKANKINQIQREVRDAFKEKFDGDRNTTADFDLEEANELLELIGADILTFTYSATITVTATITGIDASSEKEAEEKALEAVSLQFDASAAGDDAEIDDEEYEVSDIEEE
jgi:hypothetical protein